MDMKQAVGIRSCNIDATSGAKLSHEEVYGRVIDYLGGVGVVSGFVPFTKEQIAEALKTDEHLNNLPMKRWDNAAGFVCRGADCDFVGSPLWRHFRRHGIISASCAECVCLLKECARRMVC